MTPSEASEAQRRKRNELMGQLATQGRLAPVETDGTATPVAEATAMFLDHVRVHSPDKPKTLQRYKKVLEHFERILGRRKFIEAVTRADIDDYQAARSRETSQQHKDRPIAARTINYEASVLRTLYYFLINERGLRMDNPCARFKALKDPKQKAHRRPPTYKQEEIDKLLAACHDIDKIVFAALLLTGLREQELYFLAWPDLDLKDPRRASVRVTGDGKEGFSPKDYEEREIPIPKDLALLLKKLPLRSEWVFTTAKGRRLNHLLRRLKEIAEQSCGMTH